MTLEELADVVTSICMLHGEFTLRSGQKSNFYFDKYLFESDPFILREIAKRIYVRIPRKIEILAGLETGGIPLATVISQIALSEYGPLPTIFVRKEAKTYGTAKLAEGVAFKGKQVGLIEDVVTTGGQVIKSANDLRERGAVIEQVFCVIQRDPKATEILASHNLILNPLFNYEDGKLVPFK